MDAPNQSNKKTKGGQARVICKNCALMLALHCYEKHVWFHLVRDPLVWGMYFLAWCNRIDSRTHKTGNTGCKGCIRFMKSELEKKSPTFRFLNKLIGPLFGRFRNGMLSEKELKEAKEIAENSYGNL